MDSIFDILTTWAKYPSIYKEMERRKKKEKDEKTLFLIASFLRVLTRIVFYATMTAYPPRPQPILSEFGLFICLC